MKGRVLDLRRIKSYAKLLYYTAGETNLAAVIKYLLLNNDGNEKSIHSKTLLHNTYKTSGKTRLKKKKRE